MILQLYVDAFNRILADILTKQVHNLLTEARIMLDEPWCTFLTGKERLKVLQICQVGLARGLAFAVSQEGYVQLTNLLCHNSLDKGLAQNIKNAYKFARANVSVKDGILLDWRAVFLSLRSGQRYCRDALFRVYYVLMKRRCFSCRTVQTSRNTVPLDRRNTTV